MTNTYLNDVSSEPQNVLSNHMHSHSSFESYWIALRASIVLMVICGALYTGFATQLGSLLFPYQATGSLIEVKGRHIGSELIGQSFSHNKYFHGRPSAAGYDPMATSGSNLAPSNPLLRERVQSDSLAVQEREKIDASSVPVDLVSASGAGLDPHISPQSAYLQVQRIAQERDLNEESVKVLVDSFIEQPQWGVLGEPRVNVLKLNLALDGLN